MIASLDDDDYCWARSINMCSNKIEHDKFSCWYGIWREKNSFHAHRKFPKKNLKLQTEGDIGRVFAGFLSCDEAYNYSQDQTGIIHFFWRAKTQ